jgi:hypothetical protein
MFNRLVFRMFQIMGEESKDLMFHESISNPEHFFTKLKEKVTDDQKHLIEQAIQRQRAVSKLVSYVEEKKLSHDRGSQSELLKAIIDFESTQSGDSTLTPSRIDFIQESFFQLDDFFHGRYWTNLTSIVEDRGELFLTPEEEAALKEIENPDHKRSYIFQCVGPRLHPVWYLVVSLSRCLQQGEHPVLPEDAYWIGLVDEVVGAPLLSVRNMMEREAEQDANQESS